MVTPVPERLHTVTPRLVVRGATKAIDFYRQAFGARLVDEPFKMPNGHVVHAEVSIGDSIVYVTDETDDPIAGAAPPSVDGRITTILALNVADVDQVWNRAVRAGCEVIYPLADQFYGDRAGRLRDPFGHQWMLSTHIEDVDRDELDRRIRAFGESGG
jgi:PhnB protein